MKKIKIAIYLFVVFSSVDTFGQPASFDSIWKRNLYRKFLSTQEVGNDSCYYAYCLLKINLDKNSRITSMQFSDNADTLVKNSFTRILKDGKNIDPLLEKEARRAHVKNVSLIIPIGIFSWGNCPTVLSEILINKDLYTFNSRYLTGNCVFLEPFTLITKVSPGKAPLTKPAWKIEAER